MNTPIDIEELLEFVVGRLFGGEDDDRLAKWAATAPPADAAQVRARAYAAAKRKARASDLEPLRRILTDLTGDPELAAFNRPTGGAGVALARQEGSGQRDALCEVRERGSGRYGAADSRARPREGRRPSQQRAGGRDQVLNCPEDEIHKIIKRGY